MIEYFLESKSSAGGTTKALPSSAASDTLRWMELSGKTGWLSLMSSTATWTVMMMMMMMTTTMITMATAMMMVMVIMMMMVVVIILLWW